MGADVVGENEWRKLTGHTHQKTFFSSLHDTQRLQVRMSKRGKHAILYKQSTWEQKERGKREKAKHYIGTAESLHANAVEWCGVVFTKCESLHALYIAFANLAVYFADDRRCLPPCTLPGASFTRYDFLLLCCLA